jgi:hypothetical protein
MSEIYAIYCYPKRPKPLEAPPDIPAKYRTPGGYEFPLKNQEAERDWRRILRARAKDVAVVHLTDGGWLCVGSRPFGVATMSYALHAGLFFQAGATTPGKIWSSGRLEASDLRRLRKKLPEDVYASLLAEALERT